MVPSPSVSTNHQIFKLFATVTGHIFGNESVVEIAVGDLSIQGVVVATKHDITIKEIFFERLDKWMLFTDGRVVCSRGDGLHISEVVAPSRSLVQVQEADGTIFHCIIRKNIIRYKYMCGEEQGDSRSENRDDVKYELKAKMQLECSPLIVVFVVAS